MGNIFDYCRNPLVGDVVFFQLSRADLLGLRLLSSFLGGFLHSFSLWLDLFALGLAECFGLLWGEGGGVAYEL